MNKKHRSVILKYLLLASMLIGVQFSYGQVFSNYTTANSKLPDDKINCIAIDEDDIKWVGTDNGFMAFSSFGEQEKWKIFNTPNSADTLLKKVSAIAIDAEGNKWVGSYYQGITLVKLDKNGRYLASYDLPSARNKNFYINGIVVDRQNRKWVATKEGGVWVLNPNGKWDIYEIDNLYDLPSNWINAIAVDNNDVKWIGTDKGLVSTKDGKEWILYDLMDNVNSVTVDGRNRICVSMIDRKKNYTLYCDKEVYKLAKKAIKYFKMNDIVLAPDGSVWAAGSGLARYEKGDRTLYDQENSDFKAKEAHCVVLDRKGKLWIGTAGEGLYEFDPGATPPAIVETPAEPEPEVTVERIASAPVQRRKVQPIVFASKKAAARPNLKTVAIVEISTFVTPEEGLSRLRPLPLAITAKKAVARVNLKPVPIVTAAVTFVTPEEAPERLKPRPVAVPQRLRLKPDLTLRKVISAEEMAKLEPKPVEPPPAPIMQGQQMTQGKTIQLEGILFKTNSDELISMEGVELLLKFMVENPKVQIELSGHTDRNPDKSNPEYERIRQDYLELSQRRVDAVANFLVRGGVDRARIVTKAYGGERPLSASFHSEKNRRVELKVLKME